MSWMKHGIGTSCQMTVSSSCLCCQDFIYCVQHVPFTAYRCQHVAVWTAWMHCACKNPLSTRQPGVQVCTNECCRMQPWQGLLWTSNCNSPAIVICKLPAAFDSSAMIKMQTCRCHLACKGSTTSQMSCSKNLNLL